MVVYDEKKNISSVKLCNINKTDEITRKIKSDVNHFSTRNKLAFLDFIDAFLVKKNQIEYSLMRSHTLVTGSKSIGIRSRDTQISYSAARTGNIICIEMMIGYFYPTCERYVLYFFVSVYACADFTSIILTSQRGGIYQSRP